jgi:hypothetical protein
MVDPLAALAYAACIVLLAVFDVWFPFNSAITVGSALAVAATLQFDAVVVMAMIAVAEIIAVVSDRRPDSFERGLTRLSERTLAVAVASLMMLATSHFPGTPISALQPFDYVMLLLIALTFPSIEIIANAVVATLLRSNTIPSWPDTRLGMGGWMVAAQASVGLLSFIMYQSMGIWGLIVAVVLVLVMRQSFVLLMQVREAYESTLDVLIRTMDVQRPGRVATAERVAEVCVEAGAMCGLHGPQLDRLRYAALLYDVGLSEAEDTVQGGQVALSRISSRVVSDVSFLAGVVPVLALCESGDTTDATDESLISAAIVMTASAALEGSDPDPDLACVIAALAPPVAVRVDEAVKRLVNRSEAADGHVVAGGE